MDEEVGKRCVVWRSLVMRQTGVIRQFAGMKVQVAVDIDALRTRLEWFDVSEVELLA